jgi:hypothetical protein
MGPDSIEIVIRAEKLFVIGIGDDDAGRIRTVGEFYPRICSKLRVSPPPSPVTSEKFP